MPNAILTPSAITREALRVLHQKCNFIGNINRQYDSSFAQDGAKIGSDLRIRLPNQYTVRSGAALSAQDTTEQSTTLTVNNQKGVDTSFTSADLTLSLDDFSSRIIEPAMAVLAANIEADAFNMYKDVYNVVDQDATAFTLNTVLNGRKLLNDNLTPMDNNRVALLSTASNVKIVDALKGLFHDSKEVSKQYKEGMMGRTAGFDFYETVRTVRHQTGTAAKTTGYLTNAGTAQTGSTLVVDTGTTTFLAGDVITIAGVFRVDPETKVSSGELQQFVITADSGTSATSLSISPAIVASGARQNVSNGAADNQAIVKVAAGANEFMNTDLVFHKDAFTFATADLIIPKGVDMAAREVMDGISLRLVRDYDINNDAMPVRLDVLYGYKTLRAQLAARLHADG
jgi:hypothetical protein